MQSAAREVHEIAGLHSPRENPRSLETYGEVQWIDLDFVCF